jgi:hypothetical protein
LAPFARPGQAADIEIVTWKKIHDEDAERYHGLVEFARNLERQLDKGALWPKAHLTEADIQELERRLSAICPALREEAFLPHWDYQAEHKLPIIPEPLGLISLSRSEQRVDPIASMGCAVVVVVVLLVLVILALFILAQSWWASRSFARQSNLASRIEWKQVFATPGLATGRSR